ncbi:vgr related protein [Sphingosinicella rhizophila]|uniref:Vgr related protein n=1 Tax=Sphingosinicella rhizophila TaxID=3050082 RepID=A0ABU3Q9J4_9SPHN|nr:vgr related protein [Sphingosinicella sp. GR2756]MDT9599779.1 vgr related protein [Sphingosinicella sp. GR2756]
MRDIKARPLTPGECALAGSVFGSSIDYSKATIVRGKWFPFQPRNIVMAPCGHIHFHPKSHLWSEDFSREPLPAQGLFIHEMTHVWQSQERGRFYLPLMRHPCCRYDYALRPSWPLARYGLEQQAEIVRHFFLLREGAIVPGAPPQSTYRSILPFTPWPET